ncbi:hypothetical protein SmJEL517_g04105 [Synchytrium microbalum]|uniref:Uncharacterized protein n=1 Tax=Synchytrium microbalum TaxID=1806994 RepID=A0A507C484_9FUNG|nr:uncharacterized protein SmJEL517_g04105 [Synchytrium microbalum]TPX32924.1 hypothetical protein SmJEL517_g04105 [Synchytrium microbalum]
MPPVDLSKLPETVTPTRFNKRDLILYAIGIGADELKFVYELDKDFQAIPTYPLVLPFRGMSNDVIDFVKASSEGNRGQIPGIKIEPGKGLDGERYIEIIRPMPLGGDFLIKTKTTGVYDVGKAAIIETENLITDKNGVEYVKLVGQGFIRDAGGFGGPRPPKPSLDTQIPNRPADKVVTYKTLQQQAVIYRLSGDYNPLHIDPEFSGKVGMKVPILHGLGSYGHAARALLKAYCDNDALRFKSMRGRFTNMVLPGQTLSTEMWLVRTEGNKQLIAFQTRIVETGVVAIGGGVAVLLTAGSKL